MSHVWVDLLYPNVCVGCDRWLWRPARRLPLCDCCAPEHVPLAPDERQTGGIHACEAYEGPLARALARLKFSADLALAGPLGRHLATSPIWSEGWDAIVPVPLHWRRALRRGFNQTTLLVAHARHQLSSPPPLREAWLRRTRATPSQRDLPAHRRRANVEGAFACPDALAVRGARVLVIDDVVTTGATLGAAMCVLAAAGASRVGGLALLRTLA